MEEETRDTHTDDCFYTETHQTREIARLSLLSVCLWQVLDVCPLPGLAVQPSEGVVPSGGQAALQVHFKPDSVIKFDIRVEVRERRGEAFYGDSSTCV